MQVDGKIDGPPSWSKCWAASAPMPFLRPVGTYWRRAQGTVEASCFEGEIVWRSGMTVALHQFLQSSALQVRIILCNGKGLCKSSLGAECILQNKVTEVRWLLLCHASGTHCSHCTTDKYSYLILVAAFCLQQSWQVQRLLPKEWWQSCEFPLRFDLQDLFHKPMCLVRHKLTVQQLHLPSLSIASSSFHLCTANHFVEAWLRMQIWWLQLRSTSSLYNNLRTTVLQWEWSAKTI